MNEKKRELDENDANKNSFESFLLKELEIVANAHFNNTDTISSFFRYYLLISAIPITGFIPLLKTTEGEGINLDIFSSQLILIIPFISYVISIIGLFVIGYLTSLRSTCVVYARTANGIRKYFYDLKVIKDEGLEKKIIVLPTDTTKPRFVELLDFGFSIYAVAFINGIYTGAGTFCLLTHLEQCKEQCNLFSLLAFLVVFFMSILLYIVLGWLREKGKPAP
jgi:hypothetical protein